MEETLQIKKDNAVKAYYGADPKGKELLENLLGKSNLSIKMTDMVKNFDDVLTISGFTKFDRMCWETDDEYAFRQLKLIAAVLNEGWLPDWNNSSQYKYYPYFDMRNSFSLCYVLCSGFSDVPSRLCFKSEELALFAAKTFLEIYKNYYTF